MYLKYRLKEQGLKEEVLTFVKLTHSCILLESSCTSYNYQSVVGLSNLDCEFFKIPDVQIRSLFRNFFCGIYVLNECPLTSRLRVNLELFISMLI